MALTSGEQDILDAIVVGSENDPHNPEFPPDNPHFPASSTYQIEVPGFSNVWLKDESTNPTGTHKDRMAWEIVVTYRDMLQAKRDGLFHNALPSMSIISSGSAAVAIQSMLKKYNLPDLHVLLDRAQPKTMINVLKSLGCKVFLTNLEAKLLHWREILMLTNNPNGIDITSNEALDPRMRFYDWLSYEIINSSPEYCFIPFGSGHLYENILNITRKEVSSDVHDPRFQGEPSELGKCHFIGATTTNPRSKASKLYAPYQPFMYFDEQWLHFYKISGFCGKESAVYNIEEELLDQAVRIARGQGVQCEPSGIAGLALLLQRREHIPKNAKVLIVNTGRTRYTLHGVTTYMDSIL